jgi:hypothetical protein
MAQFKSCTLGYSKDDSFVYFTIAASFDFQPHETNTHWLLGVTFMENDDLLDDRTGSNARIFFTNRLHRDVSFDFIFKRGAVDAVSINGEVYAKVRVVPLEAPPPFAKDEIETNVISVDV